MTIKTLDELLDLAEEMNRKLPAAGTKYEVQDDVLAELGAHLERSLPFNREMMGE